MSSEHTPPAVPVEAPAVEAGGPKKSALDEYYREWEQKAARMHAKSAQVDWSKVDLSKLKPSDIGVMVGPPMTEEQFREYQKRKACNGSSKPHVIRM